MAVVYWLQPRKHLERALWWVEALTIACVVALISGGLVLYAWAKAQVGAQDGFGSVSGGDPGERLRLLRDLMLIGGCGVLLLFPIVWPVTRALRRRVGSDGERLHLRLGDGREHVLPPTDIVHTPQALLYGRYSFPLRNRQGWSFYREGEIETHLQPLLRQAARLTAWQGLKYQWRHRDPLLLWPLGSVVAMILLLGLVGLLQQLFPAP